jgi:hypothetical protein
MRQVNLFTHYKQRENHFTNGLAALLRLSTFDNPEFVKSFFAQQLGFFPEHGIETCRVLGDIEGTVDAELCGKACCFHIETKIASGTLRPEQIERHLQILNGRPEALKRLILLTPDDGKSSYVRRFVSIDGATVVHLEWRRVYDFLDSIRDRQSGVLREMIRDFLDRIHEWVFLQDIAGIIAKIQFGDKSEVYGNKYLEEMEAGAWVRWNTPRQYKHLDGTGRKLMLYDKSRGGITIEAEIESVTRTDSEVNYPWTNLFAGKPRVFAKPIPLNHIQELKGFETFGKNRSAYQIITREQYRQLMERSGSLLDT